jgi:Xaa-Pro dipeptidase
MLLHKKLEEIARLLNNKGLDVLIIGPDSDLEYLTGLNLLSDERFKALFILKDKTHFLICPELYFEEVAASLGKNTDIIVWSDGEGFLEAVKTAAGKYRIKKTIIGVNESIKAVDILEIKRFLKARFFDGRIILENLRIIKDEHERKNLKKAAKIADKAGKKILKFIKPGLSEREIKNMLIQLLLDNGGDEVSFEPIVASGPNSSRPHYNGDKRIIQKRDVIVMDFGCKYNGYCSDVSRTVFVGEPSEEQKKVYETVLNANLEAEKQVVQGLTAGELDKKARDIIKSAGYGRYFLNRTGHGIGVAVHEAPYIKERNRQVLKNGMAFSVEPGIYLPGRFGVRIEDIVLIENGKGEVLNSLEKEMYVI